MDSGIVPLKLVLDNVLFIYLIILLNYIYYLLYIFYINYIKKK